MGNAIRALGAIGFLVVIASIARLDKDPGGSEPQAWSVARRPELAEENQVTESFSYLRPNDSADIVDVKIFASVLVRKVLEKRFDDELHSMVPDGEVLDELVRALGGAFRVKDMVVESLEGEGYAVILTSEVSIYTRAALLMGVQKRPPEAACCDSNYFVRFVSRKVGEVDEKVLSEIFR